MAAASKHSRSPSPTTLIGSRKRAKIAGSSTPTPKIKSRAELEQEQLDNPLTIPYDPREQAELDRFDQEIAAVIGESEAADADVFTSFEAEEDVLEAQETSRADSARLGKEEAIPLDGEWGSTAAFDEMERKAEKLREGALTQGTIDSYIQ